MRESFAVSVLLLLAAGCAYTIFAPGERLVYTLPADEGWQVAYLQPLQHPMVDPSGKIEMFLRDGENFTSWTELVTLQTTFRMFRLGGLDTAQYVYQQHVALREPSCPGATRWQVIEETPGRVLYEWWARPCQGFPELHEVALIVDGVRDRFQLSYRAAAPAMDSATRERWLGVLRAAKVEGNLK